MSDKLKPCPFCGCKDIRIKRIFSDEYVIFCQNCGVETDRGLKRVLVEKSWNTRHNEKILPHPCTKFQGLTVKEWFAKINEELDELKREVLDYADGELTMTGSQMFIDKQIASRVTEEACDTITVITSMLEAMGISEEMRQKIQQQVNAKNKERGYW